MSMTSTSFNVGLAGDGERSSSRVLRPPGGGHTDIFGGEPEPTRGRRQGYAQPPSSIGEHDPDSEPQASKGRRQGYPQSNNFGEQTIGVSDAPEQAYHYDGFAQAFSADDDLQQVRGKRHFSQPLDSVYPLAVQHGHTQTVDASADRPTDNVGTAEPPREGHHKYAQLLDSIEQQATDAVAQELKSHTLDERPPAGDIGIHDLDRRHYTQPPDDIYQRPAAAKANERPEHKMDRRHFAQPRDALYLLADASGRRNGYTQTVDIRTDEELGGRHGIVHPLDFYEQAVADGETPEPRKGKRHGCSQTDRPAAGDVEKHDHDRRHFAKSQDSIYELPFAGDKARPHHKVIDRRPAAGDFEKHDYGRRHVAQAQDSIYELPFAGDKERPQHKVVDWRPAAGDVEKHDHDRRHVAQSKDSIYELPFAGDKERPQHKVVDWRPAAGDVEKHDHDRRHVAQAQDSISERPFVGDNERPEHKMDRRHFASPNDAIYEHPAKPPQSSTNDVTDAVEQELRAYTLDGRPPAGDIGIHDMDRRHYTQAPGAIYHRPAAANANERPEHEMDRRHFASPHDAIDENPAKAKPPQSTICEQMAGQCWAKEPVGRRQHTAICGIGVFEDGGSAPRGRRQFARAPPAICEQPLGASAPEPRGKRPGPPPPPSFGQGDEPKPKSVIEPQNGSVTPEQHSAPEPTPEPVQEAKSEPISPVGGQPESTRASQPEPARAEAPKRVRVPPGGFSSGLW